MRCLDHSPTVGEFRKRHGTATKMLTPARNDGPECAFGHTFIAAPQCLTTWLNKRRLHIRELCPPESDDARFE